MSILGTGMPLLTLKDTKMNFLNKFLRRAPLQKD